MKDNQPIRIHPTAGRVPGTFNITEQFENYYRVVYRDKDRTPEEIEDMRKAFIAGCAVLNFHLTDNLTHMTEVDANKELDRVSAQILSFALDKTGGQVS